MEKVKDYLPAITAYLLIIGILRMLIYYGYFGIDVFSFLEFSEIIQLQYKFYAITGLVLITWVTLTIFGYDNTKLINETEKLSKERKFPSSTLKIATSVFTLLFIGLIISAYIADLFNKFQLEIELLFLTFPCAIFICLSTYLLFVWGHNRDNEDITKHSNTLLIVATSVILVYVLSIAARNQAVMLVAVGPNQNVYLTTEKKSISITKDFIFVGKTKNYLFFYDKKSKITEVIKYDDVKTLNFEK